MASSAVPNTTAPPPAPRISFEEFLKLDSSDRRVEWVNGEVVEMSPISDEHNALSAFLIAILRVFADVRGAGAVRHS